MGEFLHFRGLGELMKEGKYQTQLQFMIPSLSNKYALMKLPSPKAYAFKNFYFIFYELLLKSENISRVKYVSMMSNLGKKWNKSDRQGAQSASQQILVFWLFVIFLSLVAGQLLSLLFLGNAESGADRSQLGINMFLSFPGWGEGKDRVRWEVDKIISRMFFNFLIK